MTRDLHTALLVALAKALTHQCELCFGRETFRSGIKRDGSSLMSKCWKCGDLYDLIRAVENPVVSAVVSG